MPLIQRDSAQTFTLPGVTFTTLSSPSRGSQENSVWRVSVEPGAQGQPHRITREETFVALGGRALVTVDGLQHLFLEGSTLVVPAGASLTLSNPGPLAFEAIAVLPVGGRVQVEPDSSFVPPWAA